MANVGSATATSSISGVVSGLDTEGILTGLRQIESIPVTRLQTQQTTLNDQLAAWQSLNTKLLAFKTSLGTLSQVSTFNQRTVSVSTPDLLGATVTGYPAEGDTTFTVVALAQAHQVCTQGYADTGATLVGDGSLTVNGHEVVTNGLTLTGVRDAINAAGADVTATIMDTGVSDARYRLVLTSKTTGAASAISLTSSVGGVTPPVFTTVQEAQDAHVQFGSGATALDVYRPSNRVTDVIGGLTLNLTSVSTSPVTVSIKTDLAAVKEDVQAMVTAYNEVSSFITEQSKFDPNKATPLLFGDLRLMNIQDQIDLTFSTPAAGVDPSLSLFSQVGISRSADGTLILDATALDKVLNENPTGALKLFADYADCPEGVTYVSSKEATKASGLEGYSLEITQAAAQARVTAGVALTAPLDAEETLTLNGITVTLTAGMTQTQVADALNAASTRTGVRATFTGADGQGAGSYLTLTRNSYGAAGAIAAVSSRTNAQAGSTGLGQLLVTQQDWAGEAGTGTGAAGLDVAGLIDGLVATGSGQMLTATSGDAEGLKVLIRTGVGVKSPIVFTRGLASSLENTLAFITEDQAGAYHSAVGSVQSELDEVAKDITTAQARVEDRMTHYTRQFQAMEAALAKLQSQSQYLANQLAQMNKQQSA